MKSRIWESPALGRQGAVPQLVLPQAFLPQPRGTGDQESCHGSALSLTLSPTIPLKRKCSGRGEASGQGLAVRKAARGVNGRPWPDLGALEQAAATLGRPGERRAQESGGPNMAAESAIERGEKAEDNRVARRRMSPRPPSTSGI